MDYNTKKRSDSISYAYWETCVRRVFRDHGEELPVVQGFSIDPDPVKDWLIEAFHQNWTPDEVWWEWWVSR